MEIVPYSPKYRKDFVEMNLAWISSMFKVEPEDEREKQAKSIVLVSNRKCTHAIHLYEKFGFAEIPVDKEKFPYDRGDISFEMKFFN